MSSNNQQGNGQVPQLTPSSMRQLAYKFRTLVSEAQQVGVRTPEGLELLKKASNIKAIYETYHRQQAQQAFQVRNPAPAGQLAAAGTGPAPAAARPASSVASNIKMLLTPQQREAYEKLTQTFNESVKNITGEYEFLKKNIEVLDTEIKNRQGEPMTVKQLETKKNELLTKLTGLNSQFQALPKKFQEDKKKFYIECAATNVNLKKFLQATSQQQRASAGNTGTTNSPANTQLGANIGATSAATPAAVNAAPTGSSAATPQPQRQQMQRPNSGANRYPAQVTPVNAAANQNNSGTARPVIFKQPNPSIPIPENITPLTTTSVSYRSNRPTITSGSAMNASVLTMPVMTKLPPYEVDSERVMSKRKLRELVKTVGIDDGDGETTVDGDVEELLLDLADDFITNVTSFACRLAKHRKSDNLDVRDIQLHLERNWNIRIPGYAADEIRSTKKWNPTPAYSQKLQGISSSRAAKLAPATTANVNTGSANAAAVATESNKKQATGN
ncbi:AaceriAGL195Cp [[Ashbya] aceris (nom. inval.)]|nr:AaceriAGL195Cp [[Ashbya] aceris (nom. inval.)]